MDEIINKTNEDDLLGSRKLYPGLDIRLLTQDEGGAISSTLIDRLIDVHEVKGIVENLHELFDPAKHMDGMPVWSATAPISEALVTPRQPLPGATIKVVKPQLGAVSSLLEASLRTWQDKSIDIDMLELQEKLVGKYDVSETVDLDHISRARNTEGYKVHLLGGEKGEVGTFFAERDGDLYTVTFKYRDKEVNAKESDCFTAFSLIRIYLVEEGLTPFCYGVSLNVYVSEEMRQTGHGLVGLRLYPRKQSHPRHMVRIFDDGPDVIPASLEDQEAFYEEWNENRIAYPDR
jgi:hypothetical protein